MTTQLNPLTDEKPKAEVQIRGGGSDAVYAIGLFGAWYYYISNAKSFQEGAIGFVKGFFWPAFLVYAILKFLDQEG